MSQIQIKEIAPTEFLNGGKNLQAVYEVTAKHIEGTNLCEINLPCKFAGKSITVAVYE